MFMSALNTANWFKRLCLIGSALALCVVILGAYVRLSDAGLGCPDWPGCYGHLTVPLSETALQRAEQAFPSKPVVAHKAWKEMVHRYFAGTLGLLILAIFVMAWCDKQKPDISRLLPSGLLLLVILQAMLGMWTVTLLLKPAVVTSHLLGGMLTLSLLVWLAHRHWGNYSAQFLQSENLKFYIRGAFVVLLAQIFLGGWTSSNYAALACIDFPTCQGSWLPNMDFAGAFHWLRELGQGADGSPLQLPALTAIQWTHRLGALVTFLYLGWLGLRLLAQPHLARLGRIMLALLITQICLGIGNLLLLLPLWLAVGHNAGAALLLITIVVLNSKITGGPD